MSTSSTNSATPYPHPGLLSRLLPLVLSSLLVLLALVASPAAWAQVPTRLQLSLGAFDVGDDKEGVFEAGLEAHFKPIPIRLGSYTFDALPLAGLSLTDKQGRWLYAGLRCDMPWGDGFWWSPAFAVTYYNRGQGAALGSELEFRSSIEISRLLGGRFRVGLQLYHLSNAGFAEKNPGSESLVLTLSAPFGQ